MDPNLTNPIILNATLIQPPQGLLSNPAITTLLGVIVGWLLNLSLSTVQEKQKMKTENLQRQRQVYSQFLGLRNSIVQVYTTYSGTLTEYYRLKARDKIELLNPRDGKIADYDSRLETIELELASNTRSQGEVLGLLQVSFVSTPGLSTLLGAIDEKIEGFNFKNGEFRKKFEAESDEKKIDSLVLDANGQLQGFVINSIGKAMTDLADYLLRAIQEEEKKVNKPMWKIFNH